MSPVTSYVRYLAIPKGYGPTDDLQWVGSGEAIESTDGSTFLLTPVLPPFLEGFAAQRPLIHFAYILDLLRLLGFAGHTWDEVPLTRCIFLRAAYRTGGKSLRNAGAFFGVLCKGLPAAWLSGGSGLALAKWLAQSPVYPAMAGWENVEQPPVDAATFRRLIHSELQRYSDAEIDHWMRFGQPPLKEEGNRLAEEIVVAKPPAPQGNLDDLIRKRHRLAGALPLVGTMVSALTLPPRRRNPPELPIGGYADVTTRGDPAHLLPSQFALDPDEFVRRFAEKELLYFRREEPHRRTRERLVLLVDQGVRTWGPIRLALSAAVLAFRKLAGKRDMPFFIRFGSAPERRIDPYDCDLSELADRLEASDLTATPVALLSAEFDDEADNTDVVLLTHPRALLDDEVRLCASALPQSKRLFALAVEEEGSAHFAEVRGGEAVTISRFRIDFSAKILEPIHDVKDDATWTGDVEPIPFPFPIGPIHNIVCVGFDADATHMLLATQRGYLFLYRLADGRLEMLPRPMLNRNVLFNPHKILGVRGGLVIGGLANHQAVAAQYDLSQRTVKVHVLKTVDAMAFSWYAFPEIQSIAVRHVADCIAVDLTTGQRYPEPGQPTINDHAYQAYQRAMLRELPAPFLPVAVKQFGQITSNTAKPFLEHDRETGRIVVHRDSGSKSLLPHADGLLLFTGDTINVVQQAGNALAIRAERKKNKGLGTDWFLFDLDETSSLRELPAVHQDEYLNCLSPDGRYFARYWTRGQIIVYRMGETSPVLTTVAGRIHNQLSVQLGRSNMNIVVGSKQHVLSWRDGPLTHRYERIRKEDTLDHGLVFDQRGTHPHFAYDPTRFFAFASKDLDVIIDAAGQVVVFDPHRKRVTCIFMVWRNELAAWLPDGTRHGLATLTGGLAWPNALEKIGQALRRASTP